jgi:hypothetical protein
VGQRPRRRIRRRTRLATRSERTDRQLTLALLEDLADVLLQHGYPPLRGYALAELTGSLYRIAQTRP